MVFVFCGVGLLFVALAVPLLRRRVPPNTWYGLRVGETMADSEVWYEANQRSARDFLRLGVGFAVLAVALSFVPWHDDQSYALVCALVLVVGVLIYTLRALKIARDVEAEVRARRARRA